MSTGMPRLKRHWTVVAHDADTVEFRHGAWNPTSFTVNDESRCGRLLAIVDLLDGRHSVHAVATAAGAPREEVQSVVDELNTLGLLEDGASHALDFYLDQFVPNLTPFHRPSGDPRWPVLILGDPKLCRDLSDILSAGLPSAAVSRCEDDELIRGLSQIAALGSYDGLALERLADRYSAWVGTFVVYVNSTVRPLEAQGLNRLSLLLRFPWHHAVADGPFLLIGPTTVPSRSACFECLETRVTMNLREEASYQVYKRAIAEGRVRHALEPLDAVLAQLLTSFTALAATNFALTGTEFTVGKLLSIYLPTMEFRYNDVLRVPGCGACGSSVQADDQELYFELRALLDHDR